MNEMPPSSSAEVPTLTEVVPDAAAVPGSGPVHATSARVVPLHAAVAPNMLDIDLGADVKPAVDNDGLFLDVLDELRVQMDRMVEYRLREALAPVVARAVDRLVDEARQELESTLNDVLHRCVSQVIARNRPR